MIVVIDPSGAVSLFEADVFTAFAVRVPPGVDAAASLSEAGAGSGIPDDPEVAVSIAWIRERLSEAGVEDGESKLEGMLGYARSKGWVDDASGTIRSHVES